MIQRSGHSPKRFRRSRSRGQTLVEFALILPVLLLLTLGVVDFSRIFVSYIALTNAVREGALYAAEGDRTVAATYVSHIQSRMQPEADAAGLTLSAVSIQCTTSALEPSPVWTACANGATPTFIRVSASYQMSLLTPFFSPILMSVTTTTASIK